MATVGSKNSDSWCGKKRTHWYTLILKLVSSNWVLVRN